MNRANHYGVGAAVFQAAAEARLYLEGGLGAFLGGLMGSGIARGPFVAAAACAETVLLAATRQQAAAAQLVSVTPQLGATAAGVTESPQRARTPARLQRHPNERAGVSPARSEAP